MLDLMQVLKVSAGLPVKDNDSSLIGELLRNRPTVYGFHIDPSISDPAQAVTYLADAVGKTPAAMGASTFSYGDWADAFFMPKPCMLRSDGTVAYYLDPNDYTQKLGTAAEKTSAAVPIVQGNVYWNNGTAGEEPTYNSADIRCRMSAPQPVPPHTAVEITLDRSDAVLACAVTDSAGRYEKRVIYGWSKIAVYRNSTDTVKYIFGSFAFDDTSKVITPSDFTVTMTSEPLNTDIANASFDGNAMMEWPLIWYKFEAGEKDGEGYFYCSDQQVDDSYKCWCNIDANNNMIPHFYTAIYNTTGTSKTRSLSGALLYSSGNGGTVQSQEASRAGANNTTSAVEWNTEIYADRMLISALLILISKSLSNRNSFGRGIDSGELEKKEGYITGTLDSKGLFWGDTSAGDAAVKVFGMENYYGCVWRRVAGLVGGADGTYKYKLTYSTADGSEAVGYNSSGNNYLTAGVLRPDELGGYLSKMSFGKHGLLPKELGGSSSEYYTAFYTNGAKYALFGGMSNEPLHTSSLYINLGTDISTASPYVEGGLSCKPTADR